MNTPVPAAAHRTAQPAVDAVVTDILEALRYDDDTDLSLREVLANLRASIAGSVLTPADPGWDEARTGWNLAVDQRPAAVVVAASIADIAHTVRVATRLGLAVAPQGTGHNAGPLAAGNGLADAILLRMHELRGVEVDVDRRIARVEPGAQWGDVVAAVAPHGLTALSGSSHDVGVVGYTLGGGVSWLARTYGVAANHVVAIELVTADGARRRVDDEHDPELFWALRGGGGDFGVVTALEFRLFEIPEVVAGTLFWPIERADEVLQAWAAWTADVPDSVTSVGRVLRLPPLPDLPPFLSGRSFVVVEAAILESPERVDELLAPLRELGPEIDTVHPQPTSELLQLHMDPPGPTPGFGDGMMLTELPPAAVRAFLAAVGPDVSTDLLSAEIRHIGAGLRPEAAVTRAEATSSAAPGVTAGFDAGYFVYAVGIAMPGAEDGLAASLGRLLSRIEPWRAPLDYLNFCEHERAAERIFGDRLDRLRAVKQAVDPTGVMRSNHPVGR